MVMQHTPGFDVQLCKTDPSHKEKILIYFARLTNYPNTCFSYNLIKYDLNEILFNYCEYSEYITSLH